MPIVITDNYKKTVTTQYAGRVVDVRKFKAQRNCSDTLDYTDMQYVDCVYAIVYKGRFGKPKYEWDAERDLELHERFEHIDCTNLFVWRGCPAYAPEADPIVDSQIAEDWAAYLQWEADVEAKRVDDLKKREAMLKRMDAEKEHNRPIKGKKMIVCRGRKVKVGTVGVVAWVHTNGGVLLKDEANWQDRNAPGTWINAEYLKSVEPFNG